MAWDSSRARAALYARVSTGTGVLGVYVSPQGLRILLLTLGLLLLPLCLLAQAGHGVFNLLTMVGANAMRGAAIFERLALSDQRLGFGLPSFEAPRAQNPHGPNARMRADLAQGPEAVETPGHPWLRWSPR